MKRHRVQKPKPNDSTYYTVEDFNVGNEVNLYERVYKIIEADDFTKNFLVKLGVKLGLPESLPDDPFSISRKAVWSLLPYCILYTVISIYPLISEHLRV